MGKRGPKPQEKRVCSIDGCDKKVSARGYCNSHYGRWSRHGDPLAGGTCHGEPRRYLENEVLGYQGDDCLIWPYSRGADGYGNLNYDGRVCIASRLVCKLTNGEPPTDIHEAAHKCGNGHNGCVAPNHLSWKTPSENQMDKVAHGTSNRGERHPNSTLTEKEVIEIKSETDGISHRVIAGRYGVSRETVGLIRRGKNWGWLSEAAS